MLINVPYAAIGGIVALYFAGEDLSISAGIGFLSLFGIAIQNLVILITSIRELAGEAGPHAARGGNRGRDAPLPRGADDRAARRARPRPGRLLARHRLAGAAATGAGHLRRHALHHAPDASHPAGGLCRVNAARTPGGRYRLARACAAVKDPLQPASEFGDSCTSQTFVTLHDS